jgi:glycosyltransferase involved in cell wall biosynthesis
MRHLFVTQNFPPDMGGMERMNVELARRFAKAPDVLVVSTVAAGPAAAAFDAGEAYEIHRQPFTWKRAKTTVNWMRWGAWLSGRAREGFDVLHVGNIRPAGYAGWWAAKRRSLPYVLYVVGHDLIKDVRKARTNSLRRTLTRSILGDAAGVVAISDWVAELAKDSMREVGVKNLPPVATVDLGTDPSHFSPARDTRGEKPPRHGLAPLRRERAGHRHPRARAPLGGVPRPPLSRRWRRGEPAKAGRPRKGPWRLRAGRLCGTAFGC